MPHIIIEHTKADKAIDTNRLMQSAHDAALSTGLFSEDAIKVRVKPYDAALIGGQPGNFAHLTIYLIEGRDAATKKRLTQTLHQMLMVHFRDYQSVSVDARDLEKAVYTKTTQ